MNGSRIEQALRDLDASVGEPLRCVASTGSTNDDAKEAAIAAAPHGALFVADAQTRGRGRAGKPWQSPAGENIYLSLLLRLELAPERLPPLSLVAGVAVARVVDAVLAGPHRGEQREPRAMIKWPNDVYVDAHKIAGILVEAISTAGAGEGQRTAVVIGVGLNCLSRNFDGDFAVPPTSLALCGATAVEREQLCAQLVATLGALCVEYAAKGLGCVSDELALRDFLAGRVVDVDALHGFSDGIAPDGALRILGADGAVREVRSGEVTWR